MRNFTSRRFVPEKALSVGRSDGDDLPVGWLGKDLARERAPSFPSAFASPARTVARTFAVSLLRSSTASGAPRPMKVGTTRLPWRYDAAARHAFQSVNLRQCTILRYDSQGGCLLDLAGRFGYPR